MLGVMLGRMAKVYQGLVDIVGVRIAGFFSGLKRSFRQDEPFTRGGLSR